MWFILVVVMVGLTGHGQAAEYTVFDLGDFYPASINRIGEVVGTDLQTNQAALLPGPGQRVLLGTLPGHASSAAKGIQEGIVVGISSSADVTRPFLWTAARGIRALPLPPGVFDRTYAWGVNGAGTVVGESNRIPVAWIEEMPLVLASGGAAYGINEHGDIVGCEEVQGTSIATLWTIDGTTMPLDETNSLQATWSCGFSLNDGRMATGGFIDRQGQERSFVFLASGGAVALPLFSNDNASRSVAVSSDGTVVGYGYIQPPQGQVIHPHGLRWRPTPQGMEVRTFDDLCDGIEGWDLQYVTGINAGGTVIGFGTYKGIQRGFLLLPNKRE